MTMRFGLNEATFQKICTALAKQLPRSTGKLLTMPRVLLVNDRT